MAVLTVRGAGGLKGLVGGLCGGPGEDRGLVPEHHDHHLDEAIQVRLGLEHMGKTRGRTTVRPQTIPVVNCCVYCYLLFLNCCLRG